MDIPKEGASGNSLDASFLRIWVYNMSKLLLYITEKYHNFVRYIY